jgi:hypothetical protein
MEMLPPALTKISPPLPVVKSVVVSRHKERIPATVLEFRLRHSDSAALSGVQAEKYSLRLGQRPVSWENKSAEKFENQGQSVTQYRRPWTEDETSTTKSQLPLCQLLPNSELSVKLHTIT